MKKYITYIALIPMVLLALTPPMVFQLDCKINSTFWLWMTFASGFFAFLFLHQKVSIWLKLLVLWCFISSFISRAPFMSFTMFWSVIVCAYYYSLCLKIEDWDPVKKTIQAIFLFVILLVIMQLFGKDTLLNFKESVPYVLKGETTPVIGTIGNKMIFSSFICTLAPFLIFTPINWLALILISFISWSSGAVFSIGVGIAVYFWKWRKALRWIIILAIIIPLLFAYKTGKIKTFSSKAGRGPVFLKSLKLSIKHPQGYGVGTYKILFPVLCGDEIRKQQPAGQVWNKAHNDWLQILFETGFPGMILFLGWIVSILIKVKDHIKLAGLMILATNMLVHFPQRMCMSVFIMLMFLAYCSQGGKSEKDISVSHNSSIC